MISRQMTNERKHKRNRLSAGKRTEDMAKGYSFLPELFVGISVLPTEVEEYVLFIFIFLVFSISHAARSRYSINVC